MQVRGGGVASVSWLPSRCGSGGLASVSCFLPLLRGGAPSVGWLPPLEARGRFRARVGGGVPCFPPLEGWQPACECARAATGPCLPPLEGGQARNAASARANDRAYSSCLPPLEGGGPADARVRANDRGGGTLYTSSSSPSPSSSAERSSPEPSRAASSNRRSWLGLGLGLGLGSGLGLRLGSGLGSGLG